MAVVTGVHKQNHTAKSNRTVEGLRAQHALLYHLQKYFHFFTNGQTHFKWMSLTIASHCFQGFAPQAPRLKMVGQVKNSSIFRSVTNQVSVHDAEKILNKSLKNLKTHVPSSWKCTNCIYDHFMFFFFPHEEP